MNFLNNAFSVFKAKHVSYDIIMYCSFRAVAAHQQKMKYTSFYWNIKTCKQYNGYIWNNEN